MKEKKITGDDEWIKAILLWEKSHGYDNYGFTSLPKGSVTDINDAIALYKKDYLPLIEDLPEGLRPVAGDFAFNSEDPRASILVASGIITPDEKIKMYKGGKLDPAIVSQKWNENKESVISQYNSNPNEFLDKFDNERIRSYKNTNGADKNLKEWEQRVSDSRSVSNNIINSSAKEVKTPVSDKKNEATLGLKEEVPQYNTNTTRKANTALAGAGSGMNNSVAVDNRTVTGDTPPEGARTTIPNKGEYVYTGGKWRHKSGDGYDFSANATNEKLLNEKVKSGDYEVWDNKAGGYVKGAPVARTAESIKAGGEFRLGLNKKTPLVDNGEGSPDLAEQMPKVGLVPPAAKQIASKKAAGDGITPREQLPTTGITTGSTIKDALGKLGGGGDTPLAKQSELYDPESYLAVKAGKKGLDLGKFGGVTDYLPDVFKAAMGLAGANEKLPEFKTPQYFTDYENKLREQKEIEALNNKYPDFKIFKSIECDILFDGKMDYADEILKTFDLVIASVHQNLKMDEQKATARLLGAIENPYTTILGHMTGRLLLSRPGYPVDHKKIIEVCAANDVVIEINANPYRLDIDNSWIPYALKNNVMISINPDAHSVEGIKDINWGVISARKGGLTKSMTWNGMNRAEIESWLMNRKKKKGIS